jgi:hypothetical protein
MTLLETLEGTRCEKTSGFGLNHCTPDDILLEAGVFLVSVKVIMMAYRISAHASEIIKEMREIKDAIGTS